MPLLSGETLREKITRDVRLDIPETQQIACEVADAMGYAHRQGVVHRDIKPENILLHEGHAAIADFGIARAVPSAGDSALTLPCDWLAAARDGSFVPHPTDRQTT